MEKKLPKVFANKIDKELQNNDKVYYSKEETQKKEEVKGEKSKLDKRKKLPDLSNKNVNQKITAIFNSPNYVYKADVDIKLKSGKINKKIIGKNLTNLITIDNELIPISEIVDIDFTK